MIRFTAKDTTYEPVFYRPEEGGLIERLLSPAAGSREISELLKTAVERNYGGDLWRDLLTDFLVTDENPFTRCCELKETDHLFAAPVRKELSFYRDLFFNKPEVLSEALFADFPGTEKQSRGCYISALAAKLSASEDADAFCDIILDHLKNRGAGVQSLCGAFRTSGEEGHITLSPVFNVGGYTFDMLIGCDAETAKLKANTEAFLMGQPCNNVLLYGDSGSGKSTSIKALVSEYSDRGLRLIELCKEQFRLMPDILAMLKDRAYRYILYIDDLSFEEFETDYKLMKSVIEGGMEPRPDNVLIYATSNRRHLIKETWNDRSDTERVGDLHRSDSTEEKLSLAGRFGLAINYSSPDRKNYHKIVLTLADERGLRYDKEELLKQADAWEIRHGGLSGRTAKQFADSLFASPDKKFI